MPDEQTQPVNLEWNQSEDEVQAVGSFKDGNQMPVGEYNYRGKSYPIMDNNTGFQRTSSDGSQCTSWTSVSQTVTSIIMTVAS